MNEELRERWVETPSTKVIVGLGPGKDVLLNYQDEELKTKELEPVITLGEIEKNVINKYGPHITIDVWYELGLNGYIYRYGNYGPYWVEHGTTKGYA